MPRWRDSLEQFAVEVIFERRLGKKAAIFRWFLHGLGKIYQAVVQCRNYLYREHIVHDHQLGCMVLTVGNLTVGGTGKTPVVDKLARDLADRGRKVAILSRGYKSAKPPLLRRLKLRLTRWEPDPPRVVSDGTNLLLDSRTAGDEPFMLARNLKNVIVITDPDRVRSGLYAIEKWGVDTLVLDDGFQHLRLKRRLDIVLIDRQAPFGNEYMLPRGTLREPARNLSRAGLILITKSDEHGNEELISRIREYNRTADIIECRHKPLHLEHVYGGDKQPLDYLCNRYVGSVSGIARPESFENSLRGLGAKLIVTKRYADHHRFSAKEMQNFIRRCVERDLDAIITTEKDAVRFPKISHCEIPIYFLRVEIEILRGQEYWDRLVERVSQRQSVPSGSRMFLVP